MSWFSCAWRKPFQQISINVNASWCRGSFGEGACNNQTHNVPVVAQLQPHSSVHPGKWHNNQMVEASCSMSVTASGSFSERRVARPGIPSTTSIDYAVDVCYCRGDFVGAVCRGRKSNFAKTPKPRAGFREPALEPKEFGECEDADGAALPGFALTQRTDDRTRAAVHLSPKSQY